MKPILTILTFLPLLCIAQLSKQELASIDSLEKAIENAGNDTLKVKAIMLLDDIICTIDPDRDLKLNLWVNQISSANLKGKLSRKEKKVFLRAKGYANNNIGTYYYYTGNLDSAEFYLTMGLQTFKQLNEISAIATTYNNLSNVVSDKGDYVKAIDYLQKSVRLHEKSKNKDAMASAFNNIGIIYSDQQMYRKAIEYFFMSITIKKERKDEKGQAITYDNLASAYQSIADSALKKGNEIISEKYRKKFVNALEKSLKLHCKIGYENGIAFNYLNFAIYHLQRKEFEKAEEYIQQSLVLHEKLNDITGIANCSILQGELLLEKGNPTLALPYLERGLALTEESESVSDINKAAKLLWQTYKLLHQPAKALEMFERHIQISDSIESETNQKEIFRQEFKYQYETQVAKDSIKTAEEKKVIDAQIAQQEAEIKAKNNQQIMLYGGLSLVLLFSVFLFNRFKIIQKQTKIIELQKHLVEEKNKEVFGSITYAKRIQEAILPSRKSLQETLKNGFVFYQPKDIVAGDFYWLETYRTGTGNKHTYLAAADCTGHGVPGAMVSVICSNALSKALLEEGITETGKILDRTRELVIEKFSKSEENVQDGMDISLLSFNHEFTEMQWAGANNPLWIIRKNELIEIKPDSLAETSKIISLDKKYQLVEVKADKQPIGNYLNAKPFTSHIIELEKGDSIYLFTDGFQDQFGGEKGKKFKAAKFKELLLSIQDKSMEEQKKHLNDVIEKWKADLEQNDDICVIGVRI